MVQSALITIMTQAAIKASKGLVRDFGEVDKLQVSKKGVGNFVTNADLRTEKILRTELEKARPGYGFLMEEGGAVQGDDQHRWVIDPIDGTTNFIHALPYFCISIALEQRGREGGFEVVAGVIYDPIHDEMFTAERFRGAFVNQRRIRVSERREDVLLATSTPRKTNRYHSEMLQSIERVTGTGATVRCPGAAALDLAYVAAGRLDGAWYHNIQPWDIAAGSLLVREAGGEVTDLRGGVPVLNPNTSVFAANKALHSQTLPLIRLPDEKAA